MNHLIEFYLEDKKFYQFILKLNKISNKSSNKLSNKSSITLINGQYINLPTNNPQDINNYIDDNKWISMKKRGLTNLYESIKCTGIKIPNNHVKLYNDDVKHDKLKLSDGNVIDLNEDQLKALTDINLWLNNDDSLYYTLSGYAGTGKTTIIRKLIHGYLASYNLILCAPTHKASINLQEICQIKTITLSSMLGLCPNTELENFDPNNPKFVPVNIPKLDLINLIIIDESSMINNQLFIYLNNIISLKRIKTLFVGDEGQCPPIGEIISQVFQSEIIKHGYRLTKIERQQDDNPILHISSLIRSDINSCTDKFNHQNLIKELPDGETMGVYFQDDINIFSQCLIQHFTSPFFIEHPEKIRLITYTNQSVFKWNQYIRYTGFPDRKDFIDVDDFLIGYNNLITRNGHNLIMNSLEYLVVEKNNRIINEHNLIVCPVKVKYDGLYQDIDLLDITNMENIYNYIVNCKNMEQRAKNAYGRERIISWKEYYLFKRNNILMIDITNDQIKQISPYFEGGIKKDIDFGYAITIHKAQGSTHLIDFIDEKNININQDHRERNQIKYVAFSRPRKYCVSLY